MTCRFPIALSIRTNRNIARSSCGSLASPFGLVLCAIILIGNAHLVMAQTPDEFFESRIRPLLLDHCISCHSAESGKTSGGLALDTRAGWQNGGDSGPAIVPGQAEESLIIRAVKHADGVSAMPPEEKKSRLTESEIHDLVTWINGGAHDPRAAASRIGGMTTDAARHWWSLQPVRDIQPPEISEADGLVHETDQFVHAAQKSKQLVSNPVADRHTLLRRATFDLTGLPPTLEEIQNFLADESEDAWARVIDRLLASPAYGERWGRHWLDVARYADTAGDGADYPVREAWQYRNWVISAFNRNLPYDQFVKQQIAGDILASEGPAEDYADRVTATGFLAIGKRYGYRPSPDYQHLDFADVIDTTGRAILGLSLGCARCHDHKYDPVTANDYYAIYGILQSTQWAFPGGEEAKRPSSFPALIPREEAARRDQTRAARLKDIEQRVAIVRNEKATLDGSLFAGGVDLDFEKQTDGKPPATPWFSAGPNRILAEAQSPATHVHSAGHRGIRIGTGLPNDGLRYVFSHAVHSEPNVPIHFSIDFRTVADGDQPGAYRFYLGRGVLESLAVECSITATEFAVRSGGGWDVIRTLQPGKWYSLQLTLDHSGGTFGGSLVDATNASATTSFEGKPLKSNWDGIVDTFFCDGIGHVAGATPERDLDNLGLQKTPFSRFGGEPARAKETLPDSKERMAAADAELAVLTKERDTIVASSAYEVAYGVSEGTPVNARVQKRGEPDKPGDEVPRRFLEVLGGDEVSQPAAGSGRRELAEWLTRPSNPLTARVFVNRVWQWHFGRGLVATSSDFGTRGELPSHPELLDWLAARFMKTGWDVKSLHRTIMLSRTYQLSSDDHEGNLQRDPTNVLLWRFSRQALDAESIRDTILAVSGMLDPAVPREHPFPTVDQWAFTIHQPFYATYDSQHRSVYLMLQRNRRHPFLSAFDAADPNQSVADRLPTITPTQSLYLMNSPFVHQAAAAFAALLIKDEGNPEARIRKALELANGRPPESADIAEAMEFLRDYQSRLQAIAASGHDPEAEAWSAFARVVLTSNAFLFVD